MCDCNGGGGEGLPYEKAGDPCLVLLRGLTSVVQDKMPLILAVKVSFSVAVKEIINNAVISIQWYLSGVE